MCLITSTSHVTSQSRNVHCLEASSKTASERIL